MLSERKELEALDITCHESGSGQPVVLIHGLGGVRAFWDRHVEWLSNHYRVITIDYPETSSKDFINEVASNLQAKLKRMGIDDAIIVGHSLGSLVAQSVALARGSIASGLVLSASFGASTGHVENLMRARRYLLSRGGMETHRAVSKAILYTDANDRDQASHTPLSDKADDPSTVVDALLAKMDAVLLHDRRAELAGLSLPVAIICAADDLVTPIEYARELAEIIPNSTLIELEGGGHYVPLSRAHEYREALQRSLNKISESSK